MKLLLLGFFVTIGIFVQPASAGCNCCPCPCWCKCDEPDNVTVTVPTPEPTTTRLDCEYTCLDLGFIVDGSDSISPESFVIVQDFLANIVDRFQVGPSLTQSALVQFGGKENPLIPPQFHIAKSRIEWDFQNITNNADKASLLDAVKGYNKLGGFTAMAAGFRTYLDYVAPNRRTSPPPGCASVSHAVLFFTDGLPTDDPDGTLLPAAGAELRAVTNDLFFGVGVQKEQNLKVETLEGIAGNKDNVFFVGDFDQLASILDGLITQICETIRENRPTTTPAPPTSVVQSGPRKCYCCCPPPIPIGFKAHPYNPDCPADGGSSSSGSSNSDYGF